MTRPSMDEILQVHHDGITAIAEITGRFGADDWERRTPCDAWTAQDLAGHVITAAIMWHEVLDDAETGLRTHSKRWEDMSRHNDEYLAALPDASGRDRITDFVDRATGWCDRVSHADPDLPIPVAIQDVCPTPLTVCLFAWLAGVEFHLHAWDFAQTIGEDHRTEHAAMLLEARATLFHVPIEGTDPWDQIIRLHRT